MAEVNEPSPRLHYARTWSATRRHFQSPTDETKTLCGGRVFLSEFWTDEDGTPQQTPLDVLFLEANEQRPMCARCAKSAAKLSNA